jgi:hypothetical protein
LRICYNQITRYQEEIHLFPSRKPPEIPHYPGRLIGMGVGLGLVFGAALGFFTSNMLLGIVIGISGGALIGWLLERRKKDADEAQ